MQVMFLSYSFYFSGIDIIDYCIIFTIYQHRGLEAMICNGSVLSSVLSLSGGRGEKDSHMASLLCDIAGFGHLPIV